MFLLGRREPAAGGKIAPVRSTSALVLSSTNSSRERIYVQQPPIAASGYSSQAFNPHYPHTERKTETKTCTDCHLSKDNDNNAIMAQLLAHGTNFVNFVGYNAYVGGDGEISGVHVTEWDEPQAVIGSYLHKYAYPDWYAQHEKNGRELAARLSATAPATRGCLQLRGEYLYVAEGSSGVQVYDVASVGEQGRFAAMRSRRRSARSATTRRSARRTRPASRCRRTSRSIRRATPATRCAWRIWSSRSTRCTTTRTSPTRRKA